MKNFTKKKSDSIQEEFEERKRKIANFSRSCSLELNQRFTTIEINQETFFCPTKQVQIYSSNKTFNELLYTAFGTKDLGMVNAFLKYKETCQKTRRDVGFQPDIIDLDFSYKNSSGTSIALLCLWMNDDKLFKFALEKGANIHDFYEGNTTILHNAVLDKNVKFTKILLKEG